MCIMQRFVTCIVQSESVYFVYSIVTAKVSFIFFELACYEPVLFELYILEPATSELYNFQTCYSGTLKFTGFNALYKTRWFVK